jgi:hypothetical protein
VIFDLNPDAAVGVLFHSLSLKALSYFCRVRIIIARMDRTFPEAFLLTNAGLCIAAVTVAGVIGILINRGNTKLTAPEHMGVRFMIEHALVGVTMSYLPVLVHIFSSDESLAWRLPSLVFALSVAVLLGIMWRRTRRVAPRRPRGLRLVWFPTMVLAVGALALNVIWASAGLYCSVLAWVLVMFGIQLLHFTNPPARAS